MATSSSASSAPSSMSSSGQGSKQALERKICVLVSNTHKSEDQLRAEITQLTSQGADINGSSLGGVEVEKPIHYAISAGNELAIRVLADLGARMDVPLQVGGADGQPAQILPHHFAINHGEVSALQALLENTKIDVNNIVTSQDDSLAHFAVAHPKGKALLGVLINAGATLEGSNAAGESIRDLLGALDTKTGEELGAHIESTLKEKARQDEEKARLQEGQYEEEENGVSSGDNGASGGSSSDSYLGVVSLNSTPGAASAAAGFGFGASASAASASKAPNDLGRDSKKSVTSKAKKTVDKSELEGAFGIAKAMFKAKQDDEAVIKALAGFGFAKVTLDDILGQAHQAVDDSRGVAGSDSESDGNETT